MEQGFILACEEHSSDNYVAFELVYDLKKYNDLCYRSLRVHMPDTLLKAVPKRKADFLAGRYAARLCFEKFRIQQNTNSPCQTPWLTDEFDLRVGHNRSPQWPAGFVGSITHTTYRAAAMLARQRDYLGIGIDIESWLLERTYNQIHSLILVDSDYSLLREILSATCRFNERELLTIIFSAKESLFKALYPSVGYYFDFKDAKVIGIDLTRNRIILCLLRDLGIESWLQRGSQHTASFSSEASGVYTQVLVSSPWDKV